MFREPIDEEPVMELSDMVETDYAASTERMLAAASEAIAEKATANKKKK